MTNDAWPSRSDMNACILANSSRWTSFINSMMPFAPRQSAPARISSAARRICAITSREATFGIDDVGPDEVQQALVVGRKEDVVLTEHLARDVPEQRADLRAERFTA